MQDFKKAIKLGEFALRHPVVILGDIARAEERKERRAAKRV
jgi:hypothetical protein